MGVDGGVDSSVCERVSLAPCTKCCQRRGYFSPTHSAQESRQNPLMASFLVLLPYY